MTDEFRPSREGVEIVGAVQEFGELAAAFADLGDSYLSARRAWLSSAKAQDEAGLTEAHRRIEEAIDLAGDYRGQAYSGRERDVIRYLARARGRG